MKIGDKLVNEITEPNVTDSKVNGLFLGRPSGLFPLRLMVFGNKECKKYGGNNHIDVKIKNDFLGTVIKSRSFQMTTQDEITDQNNFEFSQEDQK